MVQVLPKIPGFGEQLGQTLGSVAESLGQGFIQRRNNQLDNQILSSLESDYQSGNVSPLNMIKKFSSISPEKQAALSPLLSTLFKQQTMDQQSLVKSKAEVAKEQKNLQVNNQILNDLEKLKPYVGSEFGVKTFGGPLRRETVEKRQEVNSQAIALEGFFRDLATKGTLSKNVFEALLKRIPNAEMSERDFQGSINGIRKILKAHGLKEEADEIAEPSSSKELTDDVIDKLLAENKNDYKKAEAQARKLGYKF